MIKALIFDCFGVLITDALSVICGELRSRDPAAADRAGDIIKATNRGMIDAREANRQLAVLLGRNADELRAEIAGNEVKDTRLMAYIFELRSRYKTAMLSNISNIGSLDRRFTHQELVRLFDEIVASGDIGYAKPEAQAYEITADRLGVRLDECVFIDDREVFCEAARFTGMQAIYYRSYDQFRDELDAILVKDRADV